MGFLDSLKRLLSGESVAVEHTTQSSSARVTHTSTFTETVNGVAQTTTIEIQRIDNDWTYIVNGTTYKTLEAIPEPLRARVSTIVAEL